VPSTLNVVDRGRYGVGSGGGVGVFSVVERGYVSFPTLQKVIVHDQVNRKTPTLELQPIPYSSPELLLCVGHDQFPISIRSTSREVER